jgi:putative phage-type endonuclease
MEQRSKEWFDSRRHKLTGSNIGAALGINPWKSPEDLIRSMVREYHGAESEFVSNIATEYGTLHEPLAAMDYQNKTGNLVTECGFFVHPDHDWLGASPDGLVNDYGLIEIKCPFGLRNKMGADLVFKSAKDQPHYYAQMQVEMACALETPDSKHRDWCDFYQWSKHGDSLERVWFDPKWFDENLPKLREFYHWYLSELDNPAHLAPLVKEVNTLGAKSLIDEYDALSATIDDATARKKEVLSELIQIAKERDAVIHGRKLTKVERKGNIQYDKIPELKKLDLEPYRVKGSEYWRLS